MASSTPADEVLDLVVGLLLDPGVDGPSGLFGRGDEVHRLEFAAVLLLHELHEGPEELEVLLAPQGVGHAKLVIPLAAPGIQVFDDPAERLGELFRRHRLAAPVAPPPPGVIACSPAEGGWATSFAVG
jgi:hypothetical protein